MATNTTETPYKPLKHSGLGIYAIILFLLTLIFQGSYWALLENNDGFILGLMATLGIITPIFGFIMAILEFRRKDRKKLFPLIALISNGLIVFAILLWITLGIAMVLGH